MGFITNNVSRFVEEYNKTLTDDECLSATYIEYSKIVQLVEDSQWGVYIDFDGNNGYTVVTSDYKVYELETFGDFSVLRNIDDIRYSYIDGFFYVTEDGTLQKAIEDVTATQQVLIDKYSVSEDGDIYNITPLDRAQRNAVAMASRGYSFAITGYEGTGKTTTLVNIASDAIKNGKRVLYVSNNDTTLKKVYDTFRDVDLHNYITSFTDSFNKVNEKVSDMRRGQALESLPKEELAEAYSKIESFSEKFAYKNHNYLLIEIMDELLLTPKPKEIFGEKIMRNAYNLYKYEIREVLKALEIIEEAMKNLETIEC